jgi:carboxypeptidase PM20D1
MEALQSRGVRLEAVLDEGGAVLPVHIKGVINKSLVGVGISEKGYADFQITVRHKGGHSSQPPRHTGLGHMARVVANLERHQFKATLLPFLTSLFKTIGQNSSYPARVLLCNLWLLRPLVKAVMTRIPPAACLVRTTTAVTMAQGSPAPNVLPQASTVNVNFRPMPGTSIADVEKHIRKVVRNKSIEVQLARGTEPSPFSPTNSRAFLAIKDIAERTVPGAMVAPYLVMGGTDAHFYNPICQNIYRYAPFRVTAALLTCTHATNERVPVETLPEGVAFFKRYVRVMTKD